MTRRKYKNLDNWVIHYNVYTDQFEAATRDSYTKLFSGPREDLLRSSSIQTLIEIIEKTNGDKKKLKKLVG
jgi:hypothetical protein